MTDGISAVATELEDDNENDTIRKTGISASGYRTDNRLHLGAAG